MVLRREAGIGPTQVSTRHRQRNRHVVYPYDGAPNLRPGADAAMWGRGTRYSPGLALDELFEEFIADSASIINDVTEDIYRTDWGYFTAWLAETNVPALLGSLDKPLLVSYIAYQQRRPKKKGSGKLSSHSVHTYTRVVRTFNRWLVQSDYYPTDLLAGGKRGPMPKKGVRVLKVAKPADIDCLLAGTEKPARTRLEGATRVRDRAITYLAADTGLRCGELARLPMSAVDYEDGWALVRNAKEDRDRRVPLSRETIAAFRQYLRRDRAVLAGLPPEAWRADDALFLSSRTGGALTPNGVAEAMGREYERGGGDGPFGPHRLRHLFGTEAAQGGMHPAVSQLIMGHAGPESQLPYQHPSDATIKEQHAKITPIRSIRPSRRRRLG